ncbi:MAG: flagellar protein FliT [Burkholderiales bacterium]|nr:flagellar protein FliT [Burkholderiales bacterium]
MVLEIEAGNEAAHLLDRCENVANISAWMLAAARQSEWAEVERLTGAAGLIINEVRILSISLTLTAEERKRKLACMQRILANDAKIRQLSEPWLERVTRWLPGSGNGTADGPFEGMLR